MPPLHPSSPPLPLSSPFSLLLLPFPEHATFRPERVPIRMRIWTRVRMRIDICIYVRVHASPGRMNEWIAKCQSSAEPLPPKPALYPSGSEDIHAYAHARTHTHTHTHTYTCTYMYTYTHSNDVHVFVSVCMSMSSSVSVLRASLAPCACLCLCTMYVAYLSLSPPPPPPLTSQLHIISCTSRCKRLALSSALSARCVAASTSA